MSIINPILLFNNVPDALAPLTAGTYSYSVCTTCINDQGTISTINVEAPHPTWTNEFGKAVVQIQMVEIGGINGLNS